MGGATTVIDIVAQVTDNTASGASSAERNVSKLEKSVSNLYTRISSLKGKSKLEVKAELKDMATKGVEKVISAGKKIAGKVWTVTVKMADLVTAPLKKIWDLASNPITQMVTFTGVSIGAADTMGTFKDFEQGMANVKAISGASGKEFEVLTETAKELGETTRYSATEAASAMENLAMAGWKSDAIVAGMPGLLDLAAAGSVDLATASDVTASALAQFKYDASESSRVADVLAATASNSKTDVQGLGESLKYAGSLAGALGYSIEDVSLAFGLMGNNAIDASSAGTALRGMLSRMAKQGELTEEESTAVAEAMKKVGVSMTTSEGKTKSLMTIMQDLRTGFSKLSEAEKTEVAANLAGQNAMSGLLAIVNASDEDFNKLTEAINSSTGAAERMADTKMDTLQGSIYYLQSAVEGVQIALGERLSPYFRGLVDAVTEQMPGVQSAFENIMDIVDTKVAAYKGAIKSMTSSEEWKNASTVGKINIAWDKLISTPFTKWFNSKGKRTILGAVTGIFSEAGKILPGGEEAGLSSWLSAAAIVKTVDPIVKGVGSVTSALSSISPVAGTVGSAAALIAGAFTAIKVATEAYNQTQINSNLEERFGSLALSAKDAAEIAEFTLTTPAMVNVELALGELQNADKMHSEAEAALQTMEKLTWKSQLGIQLGEAEADEFVSASETFITSKISELESLTYPAYINTSVFLGDTEEGENLSQKIMDWATEDMGEMEDLSGQVRDKVSEAIKDGIISADEQAAITALQTKMNNIVSGWYDSQAEAQLDLIKLKYSDMGVKELTEGGFRELMGALNTQNQTQEASLDEDYTSYVGQQRSLLKSGRITEDEFAANKQIIDRNYLNQKAVNRATSMDIGVDTLSSAYADKLEQNAGKMDAEMESRIGDIWGQIYQGKGLGVGQMLDDMAQSLNMGNGKNWRGKVKDADQAGLNSLLDTLAPDSAKMSELMSQYAESGQAVPQAFKDSYYNAMELMASAGDSDAALQTFAHRLAESGDEALIDEINKMYTEGALSEEMTAAWQRATLGTSDGTVEMDSPDFKLNGDPEIMNKDEWSQKLHEIEQNLAEGDIGTVSAETEADITVTVNKGDCLSQIGEAVGVDWREIAKYNGIEDPYTIYPDMEIKIPKESITMDSSGVETAMSEAVSALAEQGTGLEVTTDGVKVTMGDVEVDAADTLSKIAAAVGTSVEALRESGITEATIETGATVTIPQELITVETGGLNSAIEAAMSADNADGGTANATADVDVQAGAVSTEEAYATAQAETQETFNETMPTDGSTDVTLTQTNNAQEIYSQTASEVRSAYANPMSATATVNVTLNWNLLNPNKSISVSGSGSGSGELHATLNAEGSYVDSPILSVVGEDGPEYIIPVGSKRRSRGMDLWMQAGHDLGVPGFADGGLAGTPEAAVSRQEPDVPPEPVFDSGSESSVETGGDASVVIENINFDVNIDGSEAQDPQALADAIRANIRGMTDDIAYQLAVALKQAYSNTPKQAWGA